MTKYISIDPGKCKCGLILADFERKIILKAVVIESSLLVDNIIDLINEYHNTKVIIGNGTSSKDHINSLNFLENLIVVEEKNTTVRAKQRFFEIYPIRGFQRFLPRDIFLLNINLDAISALIILEDFLEFKFTLKNDSKSKTWMKQ